MRRPRILGAAVAALAATALIAGCKSGTTTTAGASPAASGSHRTRSASPSPRRSTAPTRTSTTGPSASGTALPAPPTAVGNSLQAVICPGGTITGNDGHPMSVVVVQQKTGYAGCTEAVTVLADYYTQRPNSFPDSPALVVDDWACNQVPRPDIPQVTCINAEHFVIYSMWPQL